MDGWARGGATTIEACRLLCRGRNLQHARELYGDAGMSRHVAPARGGHAGEPVAAYLS